MRAGARVVAELGRPETPAETAERKTRDRALRRQRQNWRNLVASLAATLGVVAVLFFIVPRGDGVEQAPIDYRQAAEQNAPTAGQPLIAPRVPASWTANAAGLRGSGETSSWYVGFVTPRGYAAYSEGLPGTDDWLDTVIEGADATGTTELGGLRWRVHDRRELGGDVGNVAYALSTRVGDVRIAVYGTAPAPRLRDLAAAVAVDAATIGLDGRNALP